MGKRKLTTHVVIGAIVGGLIALTNKEVRLYTKSKGNCIKEKTGNFIQNPSETINQTRMKFEKVSERFSSEAANTINALEQIEQTVAKFITKDER